ncbi:hypothetical protein B0H67DRAFT_472700, partial [Lasiosphaeris hirsuta]
FWVHTMEKHSSLHHATHKGRFLVLTEAISSYHSTAKNVYAESPELLSSMVLTIMEMWVACDRYATYFYPTLLEYDTGFPSGALDFLVLPRREDLRRLAGIENYLSNRRADAYLAPAWHLDPESSVLQTSFAVRYFDENEELEAVLADIKSRAGETKAAKQTEFRDKKAQYVRLMRDYDFAPPCRHPRDRAWGCPKCIVHKEASSLHINIFREPLPDSDAHAKTLVFELKIPEVIARWRDATLSILVSLGARVFPTYSTLYYLISHPTIQAHLGETENVRWRYRLASNLSKPSTGENQPISTATEANICIPHEYTYGLYDTVSPMPLMAVIEGIKRPMAFSYLPATLPEPLRAYALGMSHSLNDVMANLSECPTSMSLDEFKAFGNLRAGVRLQWLNILSQLITPTLDFGKTSTLFLVLQAANEVGPRTDGDGLLRSSHEILGEEAFGIALIDALEDAFNKIREAWGNTTSWCTYLSLGTRLLSATGSEMVRNHCLAFLASVRRRSATASEELRRRIAMAADSGEDRRSISHQALEMSLICHGTFDVGPQALGEMLENEEEVTLLIMSSIFISELSHIRPPSSDSRTHKLPESDAVLDLLLNRWRRLSYETEGALRARIIDEPNRDTGLDIAIKTKVWTGYVRSKTPWTVRGPGFRHLLCSASGEFEFQYNLLTGDFLLNGAPLSTLPHEYINSTYGTLFGKRLITVVPCFTSGMRFEAAMPHFGHGTVRFGMVNNELIIRSERSGQAYQLIPRSVLQGDFPPLLVSEYVHWLVEGESGIEFRPLDKAWEPLGGKTRYDGFILQLVAKGGGEGYTSCRLEKNGTAYGIDIHSRTAFLLSKIFRPIERPSFIHYAVAVDGQGHPVLQIGLPRFRTTFSLRQGETEITSNQYRGYVVDGDQYCGTLLGLGSKLMMRSERLGSRVLLVPDGIVVFVKDKMGHASSWVATGAEKKHIRHDLFHVDSITRQLRDNGILRSKLLLCYLHAVTSHCLPDPFTGRTGTQEALRILRSGAVASVDRLDEDGRDMLARVASLSPRRGRQSVDWGVISSLAQHEAFSLHAQDIAKCVGRCTMFYPQDRNESNLASLLRSALVTLDQDRLLRARNRSVALRGWDPDVGEFTTCYDTQYEGRQPAKGSSAEGRVICDTHVLENWTRYRPMLASAIPHPAEALNAITLALGCATKTNSLQGIANTGPPAPSVNVVTAAIGTHKLNQDAEPERLDELSSEEGGSRCRGKGDNEFRRLEAVDLLTDWLANQALGQRLPAIPTAAEFSYVGYIPLSKALNRVQPLLQSSFANTRYVAYLKDAIRKAAIAEVGVPAAAAAPAAFRELIIRPKSQREGFISLQDLFSRSPTPAVMCPEPRTFDEFLVEVGNHQDQGAVQPQMQELLARLRTDCEPGKRHQERYVEELQESLASLREEQESCPCFVLPAERIASLKVELVAYRDAYQQQVEETLEAIASALKQGCIVAPGREKTLALARPTVTPILLLQQLSRRCWAGLPEPWRHCVVRFTLTLVQLQRAHRLVRAVDNVVTSTAELVGELQNTGHGRSGWDPMEYPESLLVEVENGILIRPEQERIAGMMRRAPLTGTTGAVMQLNMGEGKSSVIIPIVAAALADGNQLVRVIVTKPQFKQMKHVLQRTLGGLLDRRIYSIPVSRQLRFGNNEASAAMSLYQECLNNGGVLLLQLDHVLSLTLLGIESIISGRLDMGNTIISGVRGLQERCRDVVDEADEVFIPRYELTYAMSLQRPLELGRGRWQTTQDVLSIVGRQARRWALREGSPRQRSAPGGHSITAFPPPKSVRDAMASPAFWDTVIEEISLGVEGVSTAALHTSESLVRSFAAYINQKHPPAAAIAEMETSFMTKNNRPHVLLLRGLLGHGILAFALQKRWRVEYGVDPTRTPATKLAVPFRAKDLPSARSEFSHPDVVVLLTCLSYYNQGLADDELFATFDHLRKADQGNFEYGLWVQADPRIPSPLRHLPAVNLSDRRACIEELFCLLRHAKPVIDYYLSNIVFPREMREFPHKLSASSWNLTDAATAGFSGTNDTKHVLPVSLRAENTQPHVNASVLNSLLRPENTVQRVEDSGPGHHRDASVAESILHFVANATPRIQVILDVGAQILEHSNLEVARLWLDRTSDRDAEAVVTFGDDEELVVVTKAGRHEPFLSSPYALNMQSCLVYLDEAHTRGTDLRLPDHYRAAVTLGPRLPKDKLVQACMRMRKLGRGQSVTFLVPDEIQREITTLSRRGQRDKGKERSLGVMDVLRWSIVETWRESEKLLKLYVAQGIRYQYHRATWDTFNVRSRVSKYVAEAFLEDEAQPLARRYSPADQDVASNLVIDDHARKLRSRTAELRAIQGKCSDFGLLALGSAEPNGEQEQERELAPETENQCSVERPPPRTACAPLLHCDLVRFARSGDLRRDSTAFMPAFESLRSTSAATLLDPSTFPKELLVTAEFAQGVTTTPGSLTDQYHRPVQWVMTAGGSASEMAMVILSPWEVNELLPTIAQSAAVRLHMYATRPSLAFRPSEDLTHFVVPALPRGWAAPTRELRILNLFAGQLYLRSHAHYVWLCNFLGLPCRVMPAAQGPACPLGEEENDEREGPFSTTTPLPFLKVLLENIRRDNQDVRRTDMGRVLAGSPLREDEF